MNAIDLGLLGGNGLAEALGHGLLHRERRLRVAGIVELLELLARLDVNDAGATPPCGLAGLQRFRDHRARQRLRTGEEHAALDGHGERCRGRACDGLLGSDLRAQVVLLHTRLAQTLQGEQVGGGAGGLVAIRRLDRAGTVVHVRGRLLGRVARKGLDGPGGDAAAFGCPCGGLGLAVLLAQHVVGHLVEVHGMRLDVVLVVEALG